MNKYQQKKRVLGRNIFLICLVLISAFIILYKSLSNPPSAYGYTAVILGFSIYTSICMYKDYKNPVILTENQITITSRGQTSNIAYKNIMYVYYKGIPHCFFGDYMVLDCGLSGKIYVDSSYENYLTLWNQIIDKAKTNNPQVTVSPKMIKRLTIRGRFSD